MKNKFTNDISESFLKTCQSMTQEELNRELCVNAEFSLCFSKFFLQDSRLLIHADINHDNGRCFYMCKSIKLLEYFILEAGLRLTPKIYEDILDKKVNFSTQSLKLFKKTELYFNLNEKFPSKFKQKRIKI